MITHKSVYVIKPSEPEHFATNFANSHGFLKSISENPWNSWLRFCFLPKSWRAQKMWVITTQFSICRCERSLRSNLLAKTGGCFPQVATTWSILRIADVSISKFTLTSNRPLYIHADGGIFTSFGSNLRKVAFEVVPGALKVVRGNT